MQVNNQELSNLKKTIDQQKKNLEELKAQLEIKEKALVELDKKFKQVSPFLCSTTPSARSDSVTDKKMIMFFIKSKKV